MKKDKKTSKKRLRRLAIILIALQLTACSSLENTKKTEYTGDICMTQTRYRELRKIEEQQPNFTLELMDCRSSLNRELVKKSREISPWNWFVGGFILGFSGVLIGR